MWQPDQAALQEAVQLFQQATVPDNEVQKRVAQGMQMLEQHPDAMKYLSHIFLFQTSLAPQIRQMAGLQLKNLLIRALAPSEGTPDIAYVKGVIPQAIMDPQKVVRETGGSIITTIVTYGGIENWPEIMNSLFEAVQNQDQSIVEGALSTLQKICEDETDQYKHLEQGPFLVHCERTLIPTLLQMAMAQMPDAPVKEKLLRKSAVTCLNFFAAGNVNAFAPGEPLAQFLNNYWQVLGALALDTDASVRRPVCAGMVIMVHPDTIEATVLQALDPVVEFFVRCAQDQDYNVRLEALDFWPRALRYPAIAEPCRRILPSILPLLVENAQYSQWDYLSMTDRQTGLDNAAQPDEETDIAPRFHESKGCDDDDEEREEGTTTWGSGWTVRKAAALAMDNFAVRYQSEVLGPLLPRIDERLKSSNWEVQESAVLVLGAIAPGCLEGLAPHLPQVVEVLLKTTWHEQPLLRSISCWTLARFSGWVILPPQSQTFLPRLLEALLTRVLDSNKGVQEAACSAFATLEEAAGQLLVPFLSDIGQALGKAFDSYQARNQLLLYDAIGTLAQAVGPHIKRNETFTQLILPTLHRRFGTMKEDEYCLVALAECWIGILHALSESAGTPEAAASIQCVQPYIPDLVFRVRTVCTAHLAELEAWRQQRIATRPPGAFLEVGLDLLAAIVELLREQTLELVSSENHNFLPLLVHCCNDPSLQTKQSAFALVGDLAKHSHKVLDGILPQILPILVTHLDKTSTSVCNNASWAVGEICFKNPEVIRPHVNDIGGQLVRLIKRTNQHITLLQNACITLARIGSAWPQELAASLPEFLTPFCFIMKGARFDGEKINAFGGLVKLLKANPHALTADAFVPLADTLASSPPAHLPDVLRGDIAFILSSCKTQFNSQWDTLFQRLPQDSQSVLKTCYGL
uniref:Importin N-terminal domain-containing protein n=1 Tax=Chromera velia CCMP2878 TaxID=1169474 RepID=A0A0G4FL38_9ALVE|eukprot:Cvel_3482.t1-p1 / transcript=Cvel_3482.t1 / gene=Cvel_3482 / organism=Chromera_velia_CCMP2878 / gene_product=Transportin-1, putative / transcript_product=Transportin-1, putative / location=Cvel_scaffold140:103438-107888(-) / protein_length=916 / sequence_SO=supercontig / SO=protein_coding / is_pseudo=false